MDMYFLSFEKVEYSRYIVAIQQAAKKMFRIRDCHPIIHFES